MLSLKKTNTATMETFPTQGWRKGEVSRSQTSGLSFLHAVRAFSRFLRSHTLVPQLRFLPAQTLSLTVLRYLKTCKSTPHKRKKN